MVSYADENDWAQSQHFDTWADYTAANPTFPTLITIRKDLQKATNTINKWIGSGATNITDPAYLEYCKDLCVEMVNRSHDKAINRRSDETRNLYRPHDNVYKDEREYLMQVVGVATGYRTAGGVGTT